MDLNNYNYDVVYLGRLSCKNPRTFDKCVD